MASTDKEKLTLSAKSLAADITGLVDHQDIALFCGIPYATVEKRWTHSRLRHNLTSPFEATQFGPRCPQKEGPVLVAGDGVDPAPGEHEFNCLHLNIAVPKEALPSDERKNSKGIPVIVWIHGGAFNYGSNAVARFLPSNLSSFARSIGKPVVLVQINYRVGPFGFAVSKDFATEADLDDKRECLGNFGFIDQRNALQWVQDHIHEFGGDPENVTAAGNSAGSTSIHYHILSGTRFFDRAIMMSGTAGCLGPMSFELHEKEWLKAATLCGISQLPPAIRFHTMRSLSPELLIQVYTAKAMGPYGDGKLLPLSWTYGDHTAPSRCKSIILGDTRNEGIIFDIFTKLVPQYGFLAFLMEVLPDAKIREGFCSTFGFTTSDYTLGTLPEEVYRDALRLFFTVSAFQYPTLRVAETFSSSGDPARQAYLYHFDDYSPFEGITFGHSYHGQCGLYLYQNQKGTKEFSDSAAAIGENMAQAWLGFAYGLEPWIAYQPEQGEDKFMRFGPEGESSLKSMAEDKVRDYGLLPWVREHWIDVQRFARRLLLES